MRQNKLFFIVSVVLIPVILLTLGIRGAAFNPKYYESETEKNLINYLQNPEAPESLISEFSENEQSHLKDVQNLFLLNTIVLAAALILFSILLPRIDAGKALICGGILTIILAIALVIIFLNFDKSFTAFHLVFFTGNWQFPEGSLLITLFPVKFFMQMAKAIIINTLMLSAAITAAGLFLRNFYSDLVG
jgi:integral membrane protein (TIGR01906 family)